MVDDLVIQNCDADVNAYLVAFDKRTGKEVWQDEAPRPSRLEHADSSINAGKRRELVLNGHEGVQAYDPATGRELWFCKSFNGRGEPTVTPAGELLCVVNGLKAGDFYSRAARRRGRRDRAPTWPGTRPATAAATALADRRRQVHHRLPTWTASPPATTRRTATSIGKSGWTANTAARRSPPMASSIS